VFDLRYHVASLAAVFIAIAVGIVIGVAIASGGGVEKATLDAREARISDLESELDAAQQQVEDVQARNRAVAELMEDAYPALMNDRLAGKNIALLCLGPIDGCRRSDIERTMTDANASGDLPARLTALELPVDPATLAEVVSQSPDLANFGYEGGLEGLGGSLGQEFITGRDSGTWEAVDELLVEESVGSTTTPVDGVVVVRSWTPAAADASPEEQEAAAATEQLLSGLLGAMVNAGVPVVGAEALGADPSALPFFDENHLSSVNDVETEAGRLALALLLAGAQPGNYGIGDDVDGVTPPIEPLPAATVAE
jgi:hypothetical protein